MFDKYKKELKKKLKKEIKKEIMVEVKKEIKEIVIKDFPSVIANIVKKEIDVIMKASTGSANLKVKEFPDKKAPKSKSRLIVPVNVKKEDGSYKTVYESVDKLRKG